MSSSTEEAGEGATTWTNELEQVREQLKAARAELAQLHAESAAKIGRSANPVPELLAANEQLVVAALRSETRFRAHFGRWRIRS